MAKLLYSELTSVIIEVAIEIHSRLGPGLLESAYRAILAYELRKRGYNVVEERPVPIIWDEKHIAVGFRADLLVEDLILVELKSVERMPPVYYQQLLTHLRLLDKKVGLLINFNVVRLKDGIKRMVNRAFDEDFAPND